jgi:hypothetical protein
LADSLFAEYQNRYMDWEQEKDSRKPNGVGGVDGRLTTYKFEVA